MLKIVSNACYHYKNAHCFSINFSLSHMVICTNVKYPISVFSPHDSYFQRLRLQVPVISLSLLNPLRAENLGVSKESKYNNPNSTEAILESLAENEHKRSN